MPSAGIGWCGTGRAEARPARERVSRDFGSIGAYGETRAGRARHDIRDRTAHEADCLAEVEATKSSKSARSIRPFASSMMRTETR